MLNKLNILKSLNLVNSFFSLTSVQTEGEQKTDSPMRLEAVSRFNFGNNF
jgi:hypothetical protein